MKKFMFVLMIGAMMLFAVSAFCADGKMMFGVKAGLNMTNVTGDDKPDNVSMSMGVIGGAFMCYKITDIIAVQPELLFAMKGAKADSAGFEVQWKFNYVEIPLLLKVNLPTEGKIKPSLYAGPALGILMSAKAEDEDVKEFFKSTDIGLLAGAAVGYQMEKGLLFAEARYEVGLTTIDKAEGDEDAADIKNTAISILVGYAFAF